MKKVHVLLLAALCLTAACKKDKNNPADTEKPGEELAKAVNDQVAAIDSLSSFAVYLKDLQLSDADASAGVTVFAPVNGAFIAGQGRLAANSGQLREDLPDSSDVEDYIVKGMVRGSDLTNGKQLTTLSGKTLTVTITDGTIRINGVILSGKEVAAAEKSVIHTIAGLLKKDPSVIVTVWDGATWTPQSPQSKVATGATVSLYRSQGDYAAGAPPAYTAKTGDDGKAHFTKVAAGTYYILAEKDDRSNILKENGLWSVVPVNGAYMGYAFNELIKTQSEINQIPQPNGAVGNPRFIDVNGDGIINTNDYVALPYSSVEADQGAAAAVSVLISYSNNAQLGTVQDITGADTVLLNAYRAAASEFLYTVMMDGYLSDDADADADNAGPTWSQLEHFTFLPANPLFADRWTNGYNCIAQLNRLLRDVSGLPASDDKDLILAQAKALRAHVYLQLLTYYGHVPLLQGVVMPPDINNNNDQAVYDQIVNDLKDAATVLPAQWDAQHTYRLTRWAATALLAKAALFRKDYKNAAAYADSVMYSQAYLLLAGPDDALKTPGNKELIWDLSGLATNRLFSTYFTRGPVCPVIRETEILLIAAEGRLEQVNGDVLTNNDVVTMINLLCHRSGLPEIMAWNMPLTEAREQLHIRWQQEMYREGDRFACLQRWGTAQQVLAAHGYSNPKNALLPVPQVFLEAHFGLVQNPGY